MSDKSSRFLKRLQAISALIFFRTLWSILMSRGHSRLKPSPALFFVALMPGLLPLAIFARRAFEQ
jgi:hypothetical protein